MEDQGRSLPLTGAQARFNIPELPPVPSSIAAISETSLRRRAADLWSAAHRLEGLIRIWTYFLGFLALYQRLDEETEDRLRTIFPAVEDTGAVLNAFAEEAERGIQLGPDVRELARIYRIERGPTARYRGKDNRWYRGTGLVKLVERFREAMAVPAECLIRNRINSPFFQRDPEIVRDELARVTKLSMDFTRDGPPIRPMTVLRDAGFQRAQGGILAELGRLIGLLEAHPHTVLHGSLADGANKKTWSGKLDKTCIEQFIHDYLMMKSAQGHELTRDKIAKDLGISGGSVSQTVAWKRFRNERDRRRGRTFRIADSITS